MDVLRESQWVLWVAGALVLGLLELTSLDFVFAMLVAGALAAAVLAALGLGFGWQVAAFSVVSLVGLVLVRPAIKRWAVRSNPDVPTNADALPGRRALTLTAVDDRSGQVKLAGETWSARSADRSATIPADTDVVVVRIEGATAVVSPDPAAPPASPPRSEHP
ncbi:NfeD family protein [Aquipuribacter nitratireducens]|uniref:NfeD family protein n=1 Tax=Aquipuribacter nitratireducens TaxID=650104 RepID=A0ABW0GI82_9MICO